MIEILKISYEESLFTKKNDFEDNDYFEYYELKSGDLVIGNFISYDNEFHLNHKYIYPLFNFNKRFDIEIIFKTIKMFFEKSLQVMIESKEIETINLLKLAGFICKRKSFECEFSIDQLKKLDFSNLKINIFNSDAPEYNEACKLTYKYYAKTHEHVNPLTATIDQFIKLLPNKVICQFVDDRIKNIVFIEDNELCYLTSNDLIDFELFAYTVINYMFNRFKTIAFEADSTDWVAMRFKNLFNDNTKNSFDTYILE